MSGDSKVKLEFSLLNVAKPKGVTSRGVVDRVQRLVRPYPAGHAGTLDPLATGVLVICIGKATRLVETIQNQQKTYWAQFRLGFRSATDDIEGALTAVSGGDKVTPERLQALLPKFVGRIKQVPPAYSAVHVGGKRAYRIARSGKAVALNAREIEIRRIELVRFANEEFEIEVQCGSGTYIRSLGRDLGQKLGTGCILSALVRTSIGPYQLRDSIPLNELDAANLGRSLLSPATAVASLESYVANDDERELVCRGRPLPVHKVFAAAPVAVFAPDGALLCLADFDAASGALKPKRVFATVPPDAGNY